MLCKRQLWQLSGMALRPVPSSQAAQRVSYCAGIVTHLAGPQGAQPYPMQPRKGKPLQVIHKCARQLTSHDLCLVPWQRLPATSIACAAHGNTWQLVLRDIFGDVCSFASPESSLGRVFPGRDYAVAAQLLQSSAPPAACKGAAVVRECKSIPEAPRTCSCSQVRSKMYTLPTNENQRAGQPS